MPSRRTRGPPNRQLDLGEFVLGPHAPRMECNEPATRYGQDEYRCSYCGIIWAIDEARPDCNR